MGKKSKTKQETESETDTDTDTDTDKKIGKKTGSSVFDKFNKLSRKAKLYIGICVVLLLAGLYMWYKNKKNNIPNVQNEFVPVNQIQSIQQVVPQNVQTGGQSGQSNVVLSHLTPNPLEN